MPTASPFSTLVPADAGNPRFVLRGLDGLRAVAVIGVIVYHLWPQTLPGGLIGVDLFFVISGYLITALLLREAAYTGKMRLPQFWIRRLRRLVPAMVGCVIACTTIALLMGGDVMVHMRRQVLGALTYTSNWTSIAGGNDYFRDTSPELFTNFWSLGVEEQFYLAWPVVLVLTCMLVLTWRRRRLVPAVLAVLSVIAMAIVSWSTGSVNRAYYGLDTHAFGLMLGACLALLIPWSMYPPAPGQRVEALERVFSEPRNLTRVAAGWGSLLLLPVLAFFLDEGHPGILVPWGLLAASALGLGVIQCLLPDVRGRGAGALRWLLSVPPLPWIGKRSYGLYLWHWPLMVLGHYAAPKAPASVRGVVVLVLTVGIAAVSYRWIENPVRRLGFRGALAALFSTLSLPDRRRWVTVGALGAATLMVAGTAAACVDPPEQTEAERVVAEGEHDLEPSPTPGSGGDSPSPEPDKPEPYRSRPGGEDVTMIGDSVTLASADSLQHKLPGIAIDAQVSRKVSDGVDLLRRQLDAGELRRIVVVSLSTNSAIIPKDLDQLSDIANSGKVRQMIIVTGQAPDNLTWVSSSNTAIRDAAAHDSRLVVADWNQASKDHPDLFVSDGVHPQPPGQELYAQTVADAVETGKRDLAQATADSGG